MADQQRDDRIDETAETAETAERADAERDRVSRAESTAAGLAARIDDDPETDGVPGVDGTRDAGVTPSSWT